MRLGQEGFEYGYQIRPKKKRKKKRKKRQTKSEPPQMEMPDITPFMERLQWLVDFIVKIILTFIGGIITLFKETKKLFGGNKKCKEKSKSQKAKKSLKK
jgi:hypothetical protein|tara:strand:- start:448 stop:744 length:297 start_codon:yes stop_codon:yes gene_type:complete